ncbi:predicted protein [Nematostella vectensis]|uniref:RRM domain-containing protein n=1 Tax=Nematostella vectensis TaxID=45351 RepID=A7RU25_NEMVE|nr:predicted protein [Nematostella vectensis]|eukprot:XP_001637003.1 predicted protein [Nematostella vectensis]
MTQIYVRVVDDETCPDQAIEIEAEEDGTLLLSNVNGQFPGACGLRYRNPETQAFRGVRLVEDVLYPPFEDGWGDTLFLVVPSKAADSASKRKIEESPIGKEPETKITKVEGVDVGDLIVLGLPYATTESEMKEYFTRFGEIDFCEVKLDPNTRRSRGFGFVRFKKDEDAKNVLSTSHRIQGRLCEVRLPRPKEELNVPKKLFVGRLPESTTEKTLMEYFAQFGEVTDVYIPKPFRHFGFVTFASGELAKKVLSQNHRISGSLLNITFAEPKSTAKGMGSGYAWGGIIVQNH